MCSVERIVIPAKPVLSAAEGAGIHVFGISLFFGTNGPDFHNLLSQNANPLNCRKIYF